MGYYKVVMHETAQGFDHEIADHIVKGGSTTPFSLLLYAVGSCNGLVLKNLCEVNRIACTINRLEVEGETDKGDAQWIRVKLFVHAEEDKKEKILSLGKQIPKYCTVVRSLNPALSVEESIVFE